MCTVPEHRKVAKSFNQLTTQKSGIVRSQCLAVSRRGDEGCKGQFTDVSYRFIISKTSTVDTVQCTIQVEVMDGFVLVITAHVSWRYCLVKVVSNDYVRTGMSRVHIISGH